MGGVSGNNEAAKERGGDVKEVVDVRGRMYRVVVYEQTESAFDMTLGYAVIEGEEWVCRLVQEGEWKAMGRTGRTR